MKQYEERTEIVQEVIDRHIKYGTEYVAALRELNAKFPINVGNVGATRVYQVLCKSVSATILLILFSVTSVTPQTVADQNPNYMNSQSKYMNSSYVHLEGTTVQVYPEVQQLSLRATKAEYKHEEKMARINNKGAQRSNTRNQRQYIQVQPLQINPNILLLGLVGGYFLLHH